MPSMPKGCEEGIIKGFYKLKESPSKKKLNVQILASGSLVKEALKAQAKLEEQEEFDERAAMLFNPDTKFSERFEAVMVDMLSGKHASQIDADGEDLLNHPIDNGEDENPTHEF